MKTYEEEYDEIIAWVKETYADAEKEVEQLFKIEGYDDRGRRLREK